MRALCLLFVSTVLASAQDSKLQFEVALLKLSAPDARGGLRGGPGTADPERLSLTNIPLRQLLLRALGAQDFQLSMDQGAGQVRVDITAKIPPGATKDQTNAMLLNLIVERFGVKLHRETRDLSGYELVIAKGGLKMQAAAPAVGPEVAAGDSIKTVKSPDGKPLLAPGKKGRIRMGIGNGGQRISARLQDIDDILQMCRSVTGKPVINKTGLTGVYDFYIDFSPPGAGGSAADSGASTPLAGAEDRPAPFEIAIESVLGLKLESKKLPIEVTVIDQMSKTPTEN